MFGLSWLSVGINPSNTGEGLVTFRDIGTLASDVMKRLEIERTEATGSIETLNPSPVAPLDGEGGTDQRMRIKDGGATDFSPTELLPLWKTPQEETRLGRVRKALSEVATVATAATKGTPRPSAVVISLNAWKAAHASCHTTQRATAKMNRPVSPPKTMP